MSSRASRRPPNVTCGAAILDSRWWCWKWRQPGLGARFWTPIVVVVENGDPSTSGRHLGWPHFRKRKWGHPRWRPEVEVPPFSTTTTMGVQKRALYYWARKSICKGQWYYVYDFSLTMTRSDEQRYTKSSIVSQIMKEICIDLNPSLRMPMALHRQVLRHRQVQWWHSLSRLCRHLNG